MSFTLSMRCLQRIFTGCVQHECSLERKTLPGKMCPGRVKAVSGWLLLLHHHPHPHPDPHQSSSLFHVISLLFQICSVNISWINITSWRIMKMLCKFAQSLIFFLVGGVHILYDNMIQKWLLGRLEATVWFPKDWEGHVPKQLQRVCCWSDFLAECGPQISCSFWNSVEALR